MSRWCHQLRDQPIWRSENNEDIWKSLKLFRLLILCAELTGALLIWLRIVRQVTGSSLTLLTLISHEHNIALLNQA